MLSVRPATINQRTHARPQSARYPQRLKDLGSGYQDRAEDGFRMKLSRPHDDTVRCQDEPLLLASLGRVGSKRNFDRPICIARIDTGRRAVATLSEKCAFDHDPYAVALPATGEKLGTRIHLDRRPSDAIVRRFPIPRLPSVGEVTRPRGAGRGSGSDRRTCTGDGRDPDQ